MKRGGIYSPWDEDTNSEQVIAAHWELLRRNQPFRSIAARWCESPDFRLQHCLTTDYHNLKVHYHRCALDWMLSANERLELARYQIEKLYWFRILRFNFGPIKARLKIAHDLARHGNELREIGEFNKIFSVPVKQYSRKEFESGLAKVWTPFRDEGRIDSERKYNLHKSYLGTKEQWRWFLESEATSQRAAALNYARANAKSNVWDSDSAWETYGRIIGRSVQAIENWIARVYPPRGGIHLVWRHPRADKRSIPRRGQYSTATVSPYLSNAALVL